MKKALFVVFVVLMLSFTAAFAQETETLPDLNFYTVGDIFSWGDKAEDIYNILSNYEGLKIEVEADTENPLIYASAESENEYYSFTFFFDPETEGLWSLDCDAEISDEIDPKDVLNTLIETYGLENVKPYEADENIAEYVADFEVSAAAADDNNIYVLAASSATEEENAVIGLYFYDRKYYEAE